MIMQAQKAVREVRTSARASSSTTQIAKEESNMALYKWLKRSYFLLSHSIHNCLQSFC